MKPDSPDVSSGTDDSSSHVAQADVSSILSESDVEMVEVLSSEEEEEAISISIHWKVCLSDVRIVRILIQYLKQFELIPRAWHQPRDKHRRRFLQHTVLDHLMNQDLQSPNSFFFFSDFSDFDALNSSMLQEAIALVDFYLYHGAIDLDFYCDFNTLDARIQDVVNGIFAANLYQPSKIHRESVTANCSRVFIFKVLEHFQEFIHCHIIGDVNSLRDYFITDCYAYAEDELTTAETLALQELYGGIPFDASDSSTFWNKTSHFLSWFQLVVDNQDILVGDDSIEEPALRWWNSVLPLVQDIADHLAMYGEVLREYDPILVENPRGYNSRMHHLSDLAALPAHVESSVAFPELLHDLVRLAPSDIIDWDESNRFVVVKNIDRFIGLLRNSFGDDMNWRQFRIQLHRYGFTLYNTPDGPSFYHVKFVRQDRDRAVSIVSRTGSPLSEDALRLPSTFEERPLTESFTRSFINENAWNPDPLVIHQFLKLVQLTGRYVQQDDVEPNADRLVFKYRNFFGKICIVNPATMDEEFSNEGEGTTHVATQQATAVPEVVEESCLVWSAERASERGITDADIDRLFRSIQARLYPIVPGSLIWIRGALEAGSNRLFWLVCVLEIKKIARSLSTSTASTPTTETEDTFIRAYDGNQEHSFFVSQYPIFPAFTIHMDEVTTALHDNDYDLAQTLETFQPDEKLVSPLYKFLVDPAERIPLDDLKVIAKHVPASFDHSTDAAKSAARKTWASVTHKDVARQAYNHLESLFNAVDKRCADVSASENRVFQRNAVAEIKRHLNLVQTVQAHNPEDPNLLRKVLPIPEQRITRRMQQQVESEQAAPPGPPSSSQVADNRELLRHASQNNGQSNYDTGGTGRGTTMQTSTTSLFEHFPLVVHSMSLLGSSLNQQHSSCAPPNIMRERERYPQDEDLDDSHEIDNLRVATDCAAFIASAYHAEEYDSVIPNSSNGHSSSSFSSSAFHFQRSIADDESRHLAVQLQEEEWQRDPAEVARLNSSVSQSSAFSDVHSSALSHFTSVSSNMNAFPQTNLIRGESMYRNRLDQLHSRSSESASGSRPNLSNCQSQDSGHQMHQGSLGISQSFEELMHEEVSMINENSEEAVDSNSDISEISAAAENLVLANSDSDSQTSDQPSDGASSGSSSSVLAPAMKKSKHSPTSEQGQSTMLENAGEGGSRLPQILSQDEAEAEADDEEEGKNQC